MGASGLTLRKLRDNYALRGALGGVAEYFGWSSLMVRLVFALFTYFTCLLPGLLVYIVVSILMPEPEGPARFPLEDLRRQ